MDFSQKKLTKAEWEAIEVRLPEKEIEILKLVYNGYKNVSHHYNKNNSLIYYLKIGVDNATQVHSYLYDHYFASAIKKLCKQYGITYIPKKSKKCTIRKIDKMRIDNMEHKITDVHDEIYEFVVMELIEKLCDAHRKDSSKGFNYYYTLYKLMGSNVEHKNEFIEGFAKTVLDFTNTYNNVEQIVLKSDAIIERNKLLHKYQDFQLYEHQKMLFTYAKDKDPKIVMYQAPTGTGKTISPIGLSSENCVIFVCAAKHVGLQLAKACVNMNIPLAIAFGCKDAGDIRLHYNAAKDIVKNYKTGGIFRVDNTVGDKVRVIVCDVQSYIPAMNYMCAFNSPGDIITYWDEPTISLDYETHEFHDILKKNWDENIIPNMILSSATLPSYEEISRVIQTFKSKFMGCNVYDIMSYDCNKTIPILDVDNNVCLPHLLYAEKKELQDCVKHCMNCKTLMRHFDVSEIIAFLKYVRSNGLITRDRYTIQGYFESIDDISISTVKQYYLDVLKHVAKHWKHHIKGYKTSVRPLERSTIKLTTTDAHTLTDGPTIYIAENVELIAKYCLKLANIPVEEMDKIMANIHYNAKIVSQINALEKDMKEFTDKLTDADKKKDEKEGMSRSNAGIINEFNMKIKSLTYKIRPIRLPDKFVPNTHEHMKKYINEKRLNAFTCDIHDTDIEKIMLTNVPVIWKMLLMLGIGIFKEFEDVTYLEIMKKLANDQKLFMIIATSDYIYGTNYQFCHEYIGKDIIPRLTQEKTIQAFGRVGRQSLQQSYSIRIRDNTLIDKVFKHDTNRTEVRKMNELFGIV